MTQQVNLSAKALQKIRDAALIAASTDPRQNSITPALADMVAALTHDELLGWVDDFNAILEIMPTEAVNDYYIAHRYCAARRVEGLDVDSMESAELFGWFDDFDAILSCMTQKSIDAYMTAHRLLVAKAIAGE